MPVRAVRPVGLDEVPTIRALLDRDPVVNVFVTARLDAALRRAGLDSLGRLTPAKTAGGAGIGRDATRAPAGSGPAGTAGPSAEGSTTGRSGAELSGVGRSGAGRSGTGRSGTGRMQGGRAAPRRESEPLVRRVLLNRAWLGGELWGYAPDEEIEALCFVGGNIVPVGADDEAIEAFGEVLSQQPRWAASLVGPTEPVLHLWRLVAPAWGPAREVRRSQPLLVADTMSSIAPDPRVHRSEPADLDTLFPASVAMFTEEVGVSPMGSDNGAAYRARLLEIINDGYSFARIEDGPDGREVLFKAEIGYATQAACQVQGVWVPPGRRGKGLGLAGMAAVVDIAQRDIAPVVSLYVNDYNDAARAVYDRVGFRAVGTFATVLL